MNDEIKEILDNVRKCCDITKDQSFVVYQRQDILKLLDYITNLQQELEEYKYTETYSKRFLYKANKDRLNANLELLQENEKLKTKTKEQSLLLIDYQDMEQKLEDYKSRVEKAIEYIKEHIRIDDEYPNYMEMLIEEKDELLNILNGKE